MRAELLKSFDKPSLMAEWAQLYAGAAPNFFLSPPFTSVWLDAAQAGSRVFAVRVTGEDGALRALGLAAAPSKSSFLHPSEVRFLETGRARFDRLYVEYADFLMAQEDDGEARDAALDALLAGAPASADFVFRNARPALAAACERAAARNSLDLIVLRQQPTFQIELSDGVSGGGVAGDVTSGFSSSVRAKIRRSLRGYEPRGPLCFEAMRSAIARAEAFEEMLMLHTAYWQARGEPGAFADADLNAFHRGLIDRAPDAADLLRLSAGGDTIGILYNFVAAGRAYNYQSGIRFEAENQVSPGFLCHAFAADHYRKSGFRVYDLMAGEAEYKRRLGVEGETLTSIVLERRGVRQTVRSLARRLRRAKTHQT